MIYTFLTWNDNTDITHSEMKNDGSVDVYIKRNDIENAICRIFGYIWKNVCGYSEKEIDSFEKLLRENEYLIFEFSQTGGILG